MPLVMRKIARGRWRRLARWASLYLALSAFALTGQADIYLQIDDIDGESKAAGYVDWIEVQSFSAGLGSTAFDSAGSTRTRNIATPDSFKISKYLDASSPYLFLASAKQTAFKSVVLESKRPFGKDGNVLIRYELSNAGIVSLDTSTAVSPQNKNTVVHEIIDLDFEEWAMHYQRPDLVQVAAAWNFANGTGGLIGDERPDSPQIDPFETLVSNPGSEYTVNVNLFDGDTPTDKLSLRAESLNPEKVTIVGFEGSGTERVLKVQVSEFFSGSAAVRIWVSDEFQSSSRTLMLSIEGGDTPYETFLLAAFGEDLAENNELGSLIGDPDKDGLRTIAEFFLGTDPNHFTNSEEAIDVQQVVENGEVKTQLRYYRRSDTSGLTGSFLLSSDLEDWSELGMQSNPALNETVTQTEGPYEQVTATLNLPVEQWEKSFLRLHVEGAF